MRMRKYSMEGQRVAQLKRLLRNEKVSVRKVEVVAHGNREDVVYVFFDYVEEETQKERAILERLKEKAVDVAANQVYQMLSNAKQRELFLLEHYGLSKSDSVAVVELVKMIEIEKAIWRSEKEKEEIKGGDKKK